MTRRARVLAPKLLGLSTAEVAQALGVSQRTIRYHLRRQGSEDRRKSRRCKLDGLASAIEHWLRARDPSAEIGSTGRPAYVRPLHEWLRKEHGSRSARAPRMMHSRSRLHATAFEKTIAMVAPRA
jgi:hypothetical protein